MTEESPKKHIKDVKRKRDGNDKSQRPSKINSAKSTPMKLVV